MNSRSKIMFAITTLQCLTFFEWIWNCSSHLVLLCYPIESRARWRDPRDHITNLLSMLNVFFLVLPFCIVFNTSFNAMSNVFCTVFNAIVHSAYGSADDTSTISMYSVPTISSQFYIAVLNICLVWSLLVDEYPTPGTSRSMMKYYSLLEFLGIILLSLFSFGLGFGFGNYFLYLSTIYNLRLNSNRK